MLTWITSNEISYKHNIYSMYSLYNVFIKYLSQYIIINKNEICIYITFFWNVMLFISIIYY